MRALKTTVALLSVAISALVMTGCSSSNNASSEDFAFECQKDLNHKATKNVTKEAPETDTWRTTADGSNYPQSHEFGGCETLKSGWYGGHSKNLAGALFAASDFISGPDIEKQKQSADVEDIKKVYASGSVRDEIIAARESATPVPTGPGWATEDPTSGISVQIKGYDLETESDTEAKVTLYANSAIGMPVQATMHLIWEDGDWKIVPDTADYPVAMQSATGKEPSITWEP